MKTEVKYQYGGTREKVYEVDLPVIPEGHSLCVPDKEFCRVVLSYVDITSTRGPRQILVVR